MVSKHITETKSRLVIDIVAAGFDPANVKVAKRVTSGGKKTALVVSGKYVRPTGATGKLVPRFGYDKVVDKSFSQEIEVAGDYDIDKVAYTMKNGVIRITVPKTAAAIGTVVAPLAADGNINVVEVAAADDADADDDNDE